ncbi:MAG TPA: DUF3267 domain-containing protein [Prolixibacteraceae bacterium]|nr:DUF3267 domain-containing protein [Prolixibacteraceae bacterium]HPR85338.1 DUF3267 domain-containing protein [Prolixibacteraceae bacterium]
MKPKYTPEDLQEQNNFELLTEVSHQKLKEFVVQQISQEKRIIPLYSIYQLLMVLLFIFLLARSVVLAIKGFDEPILFIGLAAVFSVSILIVIHELLHALAYLVTGARKISFGAIPRKFIFYALADRQVIAPAAFRIVALAPFIIVKITCLIGVAIWFNQQLMYSFLTVMCLHSLFCSGDIAMLAFYNIHKGKEIYNYDDKTEGKTYFYLRKPEY